MKSFSFSRLRSPGGVAFFRVGAGAPAVLLHGVGLRAECWLPQIRALRRTHSVFAADLPGHGESAMLPLSRPVLADFVDKIAAFLSAAVKSPAILIGHSAGALIALSLAARFPQLCRGVCALNAVYRRDKNARRAVRERADLLRQNSSNISDLTAATIQRWFGEHPSGRAASAAMVCRSWLDGAGREGYAALYRVFAEEDGAADGALSDLQMPSLFLTGENDRNSTPEMSAAMANIAPHGRTEIVGGAGHLAHLTHPMAVNNSLRAFADECAAAAK